MRHKRTRKVKVYRRRRNPRKRAHVRTHRRRVNPVHRPKRSLRRRRNPSRSFRSVKSILSLSNIVRALMLGAGFLVGNQVSRFLATGGIFTYQPKTAPSWLQTIAPARPFFGLAHILLGGLLAAKLKNPKMKDAALGIAVAGGVDIVGQVVGYLTPAPASATGMDYSPGGRIAMYGDDNPVPAAFNDMATMGMDVSFGMDMPHLNNLTPF